MSTSTTLQHSQPMRAIHIEKVTLNIGAGKDQAVLKKGVKLLQHITGIAPVQTVTQKRIPTWGLRPGLPIGCKITLRKQPATALLPRLLDANSNQLTSRCFDTQGNVAFGIPEYIDIPGVRYEPEIGILGLQVCVTLERPGFRIKRRRNRKRKIAFRHRIGREEAMAYFQNTFRTKIMEEEQAVNE